MAEQFSQHLTSICLIIHNGFMPKTVIFQSVEFSNYFPKFEMGREKTKHQSRSLERVPHGSHKSKTSK